MEVRNKPEITQYASDKKKTGLETQPCKKKHTHSSRRLKIAERNYCLMTVPSTAEMK
jgi:hypothetical protein